MKVPADPATTATTGAVIAGTAPSHAVLSSCGQNAMDRLNWASLSVTKYTPVANAVT